MKNLEKIDKKALFDLCLEYDAMYGYCPESPYEGQALYEFLLCKQGELTSPFEDFSAWLERKDKYEILLEKKENETKDIAKGETDKGGKRSMNRKKIKVYGILNEELISLVNDKAGVILTIFEDMNISHTVLTFNDNLVVYAALCDENTIGVCVERSKK